MGARTFKIKTTESFDRPILGFWKRILDSKGNALIIDPNKGNKDRKIRSVNIRSINLHDIEISEKQNILLRELTEAISVELIPEWDNKDRFYKEVMSMISEGEDPNEVLELSVRIICPSLNYVYATKTLSLSNIDEQTPIVFRDINLDDVKGNLRVSSELIRRKNTNPSNGLLAFNKYSVLAINDDIIFYIDEIDIVGGNELQIIPADTENHMFRFKNVDENSVQPPILEYHKDFEAFFNAGDEYKSVQSILLLIGFPYCDRILRWIIFGMPNFNDPEHMAIVKFIAELCEVKTSDIQYLSESTDYKEKWSGYIKLSEQMFLDLQTLQSGMKKNLYGIIISEKNGKS